MAEACYSVELLTRFTNDLLAAAGMEQEKAQIVSRLLVLTDMLGRHTHGVALCPLYLEQLEKGLMTASGEPECLRDNSAVIVWDGNYLPGLWLVHQALGVAFERIATHGVVTFAMRRSHHIACLATLVKQATDRGYMAILATSDPAFSFVAPYGGREPLLTPNPFAIGYPGTRTPVLVDMCASITTVSMTRQKAAAGEDFEYPWLLDGECRPTRDPRVLEQTEPRGSLLLLGGLEYGHKGFGLALMVEALTQGLSGLGRKDTEKRWGGNVFLQVLDPDAFAGREAFLTQMDYLTERCQANVPLREGVPVRMPGEQAERSIAAARERGVPLAEHTV
ncbi:MAG TPA: Ldh family oxidoreductase [Herpetosiphonaceae bacterium]|nr:Ldh family oxidoreductase [Herpetosiphonaceae bacterium]